MIILWCREGHKSWQCPESENVTASIICTRCGGVGHVTKDCKQRRPGEIWNQSAGGAELDGECFVIGISG